MQDDEERKADRPYASQSRISAMVAGAAWTYRILRSPEAPKQKLL